MPPCKVSVTLVWLSESGKRLWVKLGVCEELYENGLGFTTRECNQVSRKNGVYSFNEG